MVGYKVKSATLKDVVPGRFFNDTMFDAQTRNLDLVAIDIEELRMLRPKRPYVRGLFGAGCVLWTTAEIADVLRTGKVPWSIVSMAKTPLKNCRFVLLSAASKVSLLVTKPNAIFVMGAGCIGAVDVRLNDQDPLLVIGDRLVARGLHIAAHGKEISIGAGCLVGKGAIVQGHDAHGLVDIASRKILNRDDVRTEIGPRVWLSKQVIVLPGRRIGHGAVIGAGSIVTRDIPPCALAVGSPARVLRRGITWSRNREALDADALAYLDGLSDEDAYGPPEDVISQDHGGGKAKVKPGKRAQVRRKVPLGFWPRVKRLLRRMFT